MRKTSESWQRTQSRNLAILSWLYRTTAAAEEGNFACRHFSLNSAAAAELQTNSSTTPERKTFGANCFSQNISQFGRRRSRTDTFQRKFGKARLHAHVVSAWLLKGLPSSLLLLLLRHCCSDLCHPAGKNPRFILKAASKKKKSLWDSACINRRRYWHVTVVITILQRSPPSTSFCPPLFPHSVSHRCRGTGQITR